MAALMPIGARNDAELAAYVRQLRRMELLRLRDGAYAIFCGQDERAAEIAIWNWQLQRGGLRSVESPRSARRARAHRPRRSFRQFVVDLLHRNGEWTHG